MQAPIWVLLQTDLVKTFQAMNRIGFQKSLFYSTKVI